MLPTRRAVTRSSRSLHFNSVIKTPTTNSPNSIRRLHSQTCRLQKKRPSISPDPNRFLTAKSATFSTQSALKTSNASNANRPQSQKKEVIFSGIQPTGIPHLGNYLGALKQWVEIQNSSPPTTTLLYCIVDLHAITQPQDPADLRRRRRETLAMLLAVGLTEERCIIFDQSAVPEHASLMWVLSTIAPTNLLARQVQWKTKLAESVERSPLDPDGSAKLKLGLFSYPVLQAADILLYKTTAVPVGEDQVQHLELSRDLAGKFNRQFGHTFPVPDIRLTPAKRIMSLTNPKSKMSKSGPANSQIGLSHSPDEIRKRIKSALTDSLPGITYDPELRPGVSNLIEIMGHMTNRSDFETIAKECEGLHIKDFKSKVADSVVQGLGGVDEKYRKIVAEGEGYLDGVAARGAEKARAIAQETLGEVMKAIGMR